jgi:hypothetical protein
MKHCSNARRGKRVILSLLATTALVAGSPAVAANAASASGAQKPVSATHGDCKNDNAGQHKGYVCPTAPGSDQATDDGGNVGGGLVF